MCVFNELILERFVQNNVCAKLCAVLFKFLGALTNIFMKSGIKTCVSCSFLFFPLDMYVTSIAKIFK